MHIGTSGWSYLPKRYVETGQSRLVAYSEIFDIAEVKSTFTHLPKTSTARAWRKDVDEVNEDFQFTVKAPKLITHVSNFSDMETWEKVRDIGKELRTEVMVFQTPRDFKGTKENVQRVRDFFESVEDFTCAVEARGWERDTIEDVFPELGLIHIVDPFSGDPIEQDFNYYRLHGKGKIMYRYRFKDKDLQFLKKKMSKGDYLLFNNIFMYDDAMRMMELVGLREPEEED